MPHFIVRAKINPSQMRSEDIAAYLSDVSDRARRLIGDTSQRDWFLRELIRAQGFDGLPQVITKQEMDEYVASGEQELFRGLDSYGMKGKTGEDLAQQFRAGDMYVGKGIFGNGIYGADKYDAQEYAGVGLEGAIVRMSLNKSAKVISYNQLHENQNKNFLQAYPELEDPGHYAAFKGYDVIDVGATRNRPKYIVVLNRTALRVQDQSIAGVEQ